MELLRKYERFMLKNASQISAVENSLRSLSYILPGRFQDSELASQALFAALNILGLYHDNILTRAAASSTAVRHLPSSQNRYTRFWMSISSNYDRIALVLTLLQYTEVVAEMSVQKKWGREAKWRVVTLIELVKVICRLALFRKTGYRLLLHPSYLERDVDPSEIDPDEPSSDSDAHHHLSQADTTWVGARTGTLHPTLAASIELNGATNGSLKANGIANGKGKAGANGHVKAKHPNVTAFLMSKVLRIDTLLPPDRLVRPLRDFGRLAELLFIVRPLIYVLAIRRYGKNSWRPWWISFILEIMARALLHEYYEIRGGKRTMTSLEREEHTRRWYLLFFYVLRSPFYDNYTRSRLDGFIESWSKRPLLSLVAGIIQDYKPLWESVYFYTAGS
ncbi:uncharacterized protein VTP21DRAFT_4588 [Calcarisporiella thermophila]|uniref:uncharacterized protein n=1 Tax=Calcarisporiella thermophila TaxID=911321 RepID=UPI003742B301